MLAPVGAMLANCWQFKTPKKPREHARFQEKRKMLAMLAKIAGKLVRPIYSIKTPTLPTFPRVTENPHYFAIFHMSAIANILPTRANNRQHSAEVRPCR